MEPRPEMTPGACALSTVKGCVHTNRQGSAQHLGVEATLFSKKRRLHAVEIAGRVCGLLYIYIYYIVIFGSDMNSSQFQAGLLVSFGLYSRL